MANQLIGKVLYIYGAEEIKSKDGSKTYQKRAVVIDCTRFDSMTGERGVENTPLLEFMGDACKELDKFKIGDVVSIAFDVHGSRYRNKDGVENIFTSVRPYRIEHYKRQEQQAAQQQPMQQTSPQPMQPPVQTVRDEPLPLLRYGTV